MRRLAGGWTAVLGIACALLAAAPAGAAARDGGQDGCPHLTGTFLQPLREHAGWSQADWSALMAELSAVGIERLYLQWTRLDHFTVFAEDRAEPVDSSLLDRVLTAAEAHGIQVWLGLVYDPDYWTRVQRDPAQVEVYLQRHREAARELAQRLQARVGGHAAVGGWYITEEVDDVNWWAEGKRDLFRRHVAELVAMLKDLAPARPVAISGFTSVSLDPAAYAELWQSLVRRSGVDVVLFQDGAGAGTLQPVELTPYLAALAPAVRQAGAEFGVVVELFEQRAGPPLDDKAFAADPGPLARIREQIAVAARQTDRLAGFSMPAYMSSAGRPSAARLYRAYRDWLAAEPACAGVVGTLSD